MRARAQGFGLDEYKLFEEAMFQILLLQLFVYWRKIEQLMILDNDSLCIKHVLFQLFSVRFFIGM